MSSKGSVGNRFYHKKALSSNEHRICLFFSRLLYTSTTCSKTRLIDMVSQSFHTSSFLSVRKKETALTFGCCCCSPALHFPRLKRGTVLCFSPRELLLRHKSLPFTEHLHGENKEEPRFHPQTTSPDPVTALLQQSQVLRSLCLHRAPLIYTAWQGVNSECLLIPLHLITCHDMREEMKLYTDSTEHGASSNIGSGLTTRQHK